jgi:DNA-binding SARP family transcriptional activator
VVRSIGDGDRLVERARASRPPAIRLFGSFRLDVGGRPVCLGPLKPRSRTLLRYLALQCCRPRHREVILADLWPDADAVSGLRCLQVAVSSLRRLFEDEGAGASIDRDGEAYRLELELGASIDLLAFQEELQAGRRARRAGDGSAAERHFVGALARCWGELLPEDGPAEWVVEARDQTSAAAAEAARSAAGLLLERGEPMTAAEVCEQGLFVARSDDTLWRLLATAQDRAGNPAAASTARRRYAEVLTQLGVPLAAG